MVFLSVGLPGRFAEWCDAVIARLAGALGGTVAVNVFPSLGEMLTIWPVRPALEETALSLIREAPNHLVIGARQPDEQLRAVLAEAQTRFVVALDDPRLAAADLLADTAAEPSMATRAMANCCPLVMRFAGLPRALVLHAEGARADVRGTVAAIARHLGFGLGEARVGRAADEIAGDPAIRHLIAGDRAPALAEDIGRIVDGALGGYAAHLEGGDLGRFVWRRELFYVGADGLDRPTGVVDVAGVPRTLVHGPYIFLPPGRWSAQVVLGFSPEATAATYLLDVFAGGQLASTTFRPAPGVHVADLTFSIGEPYGTGIEVRLLLASRAAAGQLAFGQVVLQQLALRQPGAATAAADFASVLEL